jgi:hypothetical protein
LLLVVVVGLEKDQSKAGPLNAGELAAELGVDDDVFSYSASRQDSEQ